MNRILEIEKLCGGLTTKEKNKINDFFANCLSFILLVKSNIYYNVMIIPIIHNGNYIYIYKMGTVIKYMSPIIYTYILF